MSLRLINGKQGADSDDMQSFKYVLLQANEEQVLAMLKEVLQRVPTHGLPKLLDLIDDEYERRGLTL